MHATHIISVSILAAAALTGCNSDDFVAQRVDQPLVIDGDPSDWDGLIFDVEDADYDFGYANDDEYLYLCVITDGDAMRRQVIAHGAYLWFDPAGGENRVAGIHYPVGTGAPSTVAGSPPDPGDREAVQAEFTERAATSLQRVEILSPDSSKTIELAELEGVDVNSLLTSTSLVIEMRIPLHSLDGVDLALGADPQAMAIGLELNVPELAAPARPSGQRGGGTGRDRGMGGGPSGGGRGGGRPGGGQGGGPPAGAEEISEHIVIPLALSSTLDSSR